ncbi:stage II sporulation protein D [Anaerosolibacter carboniphilus]|uniref:Stage II sporulation protein D n=1 Tax=Anaerosolibacter carboniphilus TaxID=1417629 RepID=A0A841KXA0_9FIRM|nr:stage II sporulation protein D [Anaerosolibacter carboniphilus]MBB6215562.1 stage II sporulation protein D [Anaerosolibacter carboniphilus]
MDDQKEKIYLKVYDHQTKQLALKPMVELMKEMIAAQMPISFEMEALKAQAVLVRTLLVRQAKSLGGSGCNKYDDADFCTEGHCGDWISKESLMALWGSDFYINWSKLERAVEETADQIITMNNKPIEPRYHITCGGATENSENVKGNKILYLRKVLCNYCSNSPYWKQTIEMSLEELEEKLNIRMGETSSIEGPWIQGMIENVERDEEGRIMEMKIGGTIFKGTELVELLGLDSTRFGWKPIAFKFEMGGRGDGLGLCQYGANAMALEDKDYKEILNYYFTGVHIKEFEKRSINMPLSGKIIVLDPGHGGDNSEDNTGPTGVREKDVNLSISLRLARILRKAGAEVYETRTEDVYVSLGKRAALANQIRPNFFLSIHQNAFANPSISGSEVYHYRGDRDGETLGNLILKELSQNLGTAERGVKIADFYLLREVRTTALQIEVAFITNPEDEQKLQNEEIQENAAEAIAKALIKYYSYE